MKINLLSTKDKRSQILKNNILFSGVLKMIGLLSSLFIVPVTIGYLDNEMYGVWMTISSILFWIGAFDIGLGNGMRNYLTEAISQNDFETGRKYITTTFLLLSLIALVIFIITLFPIYTLNFNKIFNTNEVSNHQLRNALFIAISLTLTNFVLRNIGYIFVALQKYALSDLLNVSGNVISLLIIYVLTKYTTGNITYVVFAYTATTTIIYILSAIPIFKKFPQLRPNRKSFDRHIGHKIVSKGLEFFFIQVTSCLVIFSAANLFITQLCGPTQVTVYNIAYKFFNLLIIAYTIIIAPMWNAYTDAATKGDWNWVLKNFNRTLLIWSASVFGSIIMLLISSYFYHCWVGEKVKVPFTVSLCTLIYVCMFNLNNCATYLINGLNKIRVQTITSILITVSYIIITLFITGKYNIEGIILTMAASYAVMAIIHLYQCYLLIHQKAKGIWNK